MTVQSEAQLENDLIVQLNGLGYANITIKDESALLSNLKTQIERANGLVPLSETEWKQVISFLLVNGLPLVQIELKKRGMEIAEAFNE